VLTREQVDNAVLLIDKPPGITSNDALGKVKRITGVRKTGHSGTLDKFASGLLVVCTGMMTKLARFFLEHEKKYTALIRLGAVTDTLDTEGVVVEKRDVPRFSDDDLEKVRRTFTGIQRQKPPEYSALKIGGRRASDLARAGEQVNLESREVEIKNLSISRVEGDMTLLRAEVTCSKGTYIRSLARDIGEFLETGAHLESLRRTDSGHFSVDDAVSLDELVSAEETVISRKKWILGPFEALKGFGVIEIKAGREGKVLNGGLFERDDVGDISLSEKGPCLVIDADKKLIAIVEPDFDKWNMRYLNVFNRQAD
jgi:tRNA pseudouridine55 synthase